MVFKKILKYFLFSLIPVFMLFFILLQHFLPGTIDKVIIDKVSTETGLKKININVRSIGFYGVDAGRIKIGKTADIDSVYISYHPFELLKKKIDKVHISGLVLRAEVKNSHIEFPDPKLTDFVFPDNSREIAAVPILHTNGVEPDTCRNSAAALAALPGRLSISNSFFVLKIAGNTFTIPFNLSVLIKRKDKIVNIATRLFPFGEKININCVLDFYKHLKKIEIGSDSFCLDQTGKLLATYFPGVSLTGDTSIRIVKSIGTVKADDNKQLWKIKLSHIGIRSPFKVNVDNFVSTLDLNGNFLSASGVFSISNFYSELSSTESAASHIGSCKLNCFGIISPVHMAYSVKYCAGENKGKTWECSLKAYNSALDGLFFQVASRIIHIFKPEITLNFKGKGLSGKGNITVTCLKGKGKYKNIKMSLSKLKINGQCSLDFSRQGSGFGCRFGIGSDFIKIATDDFYAEFPGVGIDGNFYFNKDMTYEAHIKPVVRNAVVKSDMYGVKLQGIDFDIPLSFSLGDDVDMHTGNGRSRRAKQGVFSVKSVMFKGTDMGNITGKLFCTGSECSIKGRAFVTGFFPHNYKFPVINFIANSGFSADKRSNHRIYANLKFSTGKFKISSDMVKPEYLNPESGIDFLCYADMSGYAGFDDKGMKTGLDIKVTDGEISFENEKFHASGINTCLGFDNVLAFRSAPAQILTIDSILSNNISISNAIIKYSVDSIHSFLIEQASFKWCDGRVNTGSIRFSPDKNSYDIMLYCDRLKLSGILRQLGSFKAEGNGSLNGRIPVHYSNGKFSFDNGFLFSTPGVGGKIKVEGTDALTAGIPVSSPEFAEIDLAREALKNYKYKWAKLIFNTKQNDLYVKMEFDGEPAKILPFEFKKKLGRFIRVDVASPGSHFQGMRIDVNLKLPFNKVVKFGRKLNEFLKKDK